VATIKPQLLVIPKVVLRGASSTGTNGGIDVYVLKGPTLVGINSLFLFTDSVSIHFVLALNDCHLLHIMLLCVCLCMMKKVFIVVCFRLW